MCEFELSASKKKKAIEMVSAKCYFYSNYVRNEYSLLKAVFPSHR